MIFTERVSDEFLALNCCGRQFHKQDRGSHRPKGRRDYHILYIAKGCCYLREQGEVLVAEAGSLVVYRPGEPQDYWFRGVDQSVSDYIHFSGTGCGDLLDRLGFGERINRVGESGLLQSRFDRLLEARFSTEPFAADRCAALLYEYLVTAGQVRRLGAPDRIREVCLRMQEELSAGHPVGYYAALCGLSESRFTHLFKERVGVSPKKYLLQLQVNRACTLLTSTDLPVSAVAEAVGIRDENYFCRLIRQKTGNSPLHIRFDQYYNRSRINFEVQKMNDLTRGLEPAAVLRHFEALCAIPHGSGNTKAISDHCLAFAKGLGLECRQDALNNVVIKKPATPGYEDHPPVIIQGHLDMVCEKEPGSDFNFLTDGLKLKLDGDLLFAEGTTLGGDDGIAVAMAMAVLEAEDLAHPPIEAVFTVDEETGMDGAEGLDVSDLKGNIFLNIDSEEEGILTVSCAGGAKAVCALPLEREPNTRPCYKLTVTGLIGGHSGAEIHKGRLNANRVMAEFLKSLAVDYRIVSIAGGLKDNAIPRQTECVIATEGAVSGAEFVAAHSIETDPDLQILVEAVPKATECYTADCSARIPDFLLALPNGIQAMSQEIEGLVQTSLNLGILTDEGQTLSATFAVRSSVEQEKTDLLAELKRVTESFGGRYSAFGHYPAWEYRKDSRLRETMAAVYQKTYGKAPRIEAIHAGLECGLFAGKIPDLDAVSFGPDLFDIHTTRERMSISSVARTYQYLCAVLKEL